MLMIRTGFKGKKKKYSQASSVHDANSTFVKLGVKVYGKET
jgi:hypothetical protein